MTTNNSPLTKEKYPSCNLERCDKEKLLGKGQNGTVFKYCCVDQIPRCKAVKESNISNKKITTPNLDHFLNTTKQSLPSYLLKLSACRDNKIVMESLHGTLDTLIKDIHTTSSTNSNQNETKRKEHLKNELTEQLKKMVSNLHDELGFAHTDIKPQNIGYIKYTNNKIFNNKILLKFIDLDDILPLKQLPTSANNINDIDDFVISPGTPLYNVPGRILIDHYLKRLFHEDNSKYTEILKNIDTWAIGCILYEVETGKRFMEELYKELFNNQEFLGGPADSYRLATMNHDILQNTVTRLTSNLAHLRTYFNIKSSLQSQCSTTSCNITNQHNENDLIVENVDSEGPHNETTSTSKSTKECTNEDKLKCLAEIWNVIHPPLEPQKAWENRQPHIGGKQVTRGTKKQTKIIKTINGIKYQRKEVQKEDYDKYITKSTKQKQNMKCVYRVYKGKFYKYIPLQNREIIEVAKISNTNQPQIKKIKSNKKVNNT